MSFFQNPFPDEFRNNWLLGDRHHIPTFVCPANLGRGKEIIYAWKTTGPYNLTGNDSDGNATKYLYINYCIYNFNNWGTMQIDISTTAANTAAVQAEEIVSALAANTLFAERFVADYGSFNDTTKRTIRIRSKRPCTEFKFYPSNIGAETLLGFNARAGVAELPSYFSRHTIANRFTYTDSEGKIIQLNPGTSNVDAALIDNAVNPQGQSLGYSHSTIQEDWQLLRGKSGLFTFTKGPSANAVSTTETVITYPAGAKAGDLGEKQVTQKDSTGAVVAQFQMPYTLLATDLVTPPAGIDP